VAPIAQRARGTQDLWPQDQPYWEAMEAAAKELAPRLGYQRIETPALVNIARLSTADSLANEQKIGGRTCVQPRSIILLKGVRTPKVAETKPSETLYTKSVTGPRSKVQAF